MLDLLVLKETRVLKDIMDLLVEWVLKEIKDPKDIQGLMVE